MQGVTLYKEETPRAKARRAAVVLLGALAYAMLYALCSQIEESGATQLGLTLRRFAVAYPVAALVLLGVINVTVLWHKASPQAVSPRKFCTFGAFCLIFASFVPVFLIEYPGSFMYDVRTQATYIATGEYSAFHPLIHTMLMRVCLTAGLALGKLELGAALYSGVSMLAMAGLFALSCASISRSVGRTGARIATVFFCLYPPHTAFASNCTKDSLFAALFCLFMTLAVECVLTGGLSRGRCGLLVFAGALACMFRNNMIYAMGVWALLMLIGRGSLRRLGALALAGIVIGAGANAGLKAALHADGGSLAEMLSVPLQQLARVNRYAPETFTAEQRELLDGMIDGDLDALYTPDIADPVKGNARVDYIKANAGEIARMYLNAGAQQPGLYLDAFLNMALPGLYPYRSYPATQPFIEVGMSTNVLSDPFLQDPIVQPRRFEQARAWLRGELFGTGANDVPLVRWLLNTGVIYWLLGALWLRTAYNGDWKRFFALLLAVLLWGTYLLGPVMQGRYTYPFMCGLPAFFTAMARGGADRDEK